MSFTTGAGRGRRGAVLAVVAAMVGLAVAALPAPAVAATSQTLVPWGDVGTMQSVVPTGLSDVTAIAAGGDHGLLLHGDGTVGAWGAWREGQIDVPAGLDHVVAVSAGVAHSLALKDDGTVVAWGDNSWGQTSVPAELDNAVGISAGARHNLAVRGDGTVVGWGENAHGETQPPAGLDHVTAVAAGWGYAVALQSDGTVVAWGDSVYGHTSVPEGLDHVTAIATGSASIALVSGATAPLTTIACKYLTACSTGWFGGLPVDVFLEAYSTAGSAVAKTVYTLDGSDPATSPTAVTYTHPPDTFPPGSTFVQLPDLTSTTTVRFFSVDAAGHVEPTRLELIQVDLVPPTTTITCNTAACSSGWYAAPVTVALTASDAGGSGVASTVYTTDGSSPITGSSSTKTYTEPFTVASTTTVKYAATDTAGNIEPTRSQLIQVTKPPTAGSVVLTPTDDAYTAKGDPATPHGAETTLKVNSGVRERRTYVRFNLAGIPAGATGITASLRLYASSNASASVRFTVSQVATGWSEATLTWSNQPAVGTMAGLADGAYNSVDVSGLVTGNGTYAMVVTDNSTAQRSFVAKESSLSKPPQLVVSWTNPG